MCGFAGQFLLRSPSQATPASPASRDIAILMAGALQHRGPDEQSSFLSPDGRCAIGFHRLAVIDPSGSHQPMSSPDGKLTIAFNGEIYNYRELRSELRAAGAVFRTAGDTEVLLHAWRLWGRQMLPRLDGMFSFAIYDAQAGSLLLARDRFGQKPLWYACLPGRIIFASESSALRRHPDLRPELSAQSLTHYCAVGYIPAPLSVWANISKCPPACSIAAAGEIHAPEPYWSPEPARTGGTSAAAEECVELLTTSVKSHMQADVPLGALLSGGVDSSIIVALMAQIAGRSGGVRTFAAGFDGQPTYDERPWARLVAEHLGTDHRDLAVRSPLPQDVDRLVAMYGEPFADSSALPTWLICQQARQHVTVALTGDGGDEVFGGYDRYRALHLAQTMSPLRYAAVRLAGALTGLVAPVNERNTLRRLVRFSRSLPLPFALQYLAYRSLFAPADLKRLFTESAAAELNLDAPGEWFCDLYEDCDIDDEVSRAQRHDMLTYLPDDLLVKTDIASMAVSLELRAPMLDHRLAAFGLGLAAGLKVGRRRGKVLLRQAFADMLPPAVLHRAKAGFGVPLAAWLRGELRPMLVETLTDPAFLGRGLIRPEAVHGLLNDHLGGTDDHSHRLWALLVLARWLAAR